MLISIMPKMLFKFWIETNVMQYLSFIFTDYFIHTIYLNLALVNWYSSGGESKKKKHLKLV